MPPLSVTPFDAFQCGAEQGTCQRPDQHDAAVPDQNVKYVQVRVVYFQHAQTTKLANPPAKAPISLGYRMAPRRRMTQNRKAAGIDSASRFASDDVPNRRRRQDRLHSPWLGQERKVWPRAEPAARRATLPASNW